MNVAQRVAYNTAVQMLARVVVLALGLLSLRLTATYLGVQDFGRLAIVIAVTGLVGTLGDLGVTTTLTREVAKHPDEASRLGGDLLRFRLGTSVAAAAVTVALMPFLPYGHSTKIALAIGLGGMVFTILGTFPTAFFQANLRLDYVAALDVATRVLALLAIVVVRWADLGLYALVGMLAFTNLAVCATSFALSRSFWRVNLRGDWSRARPLIRDALGVGIVSIIGLIHFRGDALLLSLLKPARDVGVYAIAYRFVDQAFVLPGLFVGTMFPIITRALHARSPDADGAINRTFQVLVLGSVLVTLPLFVIAKPLVHILAGSAFDASVRPLRILSFSLVFIFVAPVFYNVLIALNKQRQLIVIGLLSVLVNVGLNLFLIPRYSYNGAASATLVSEGLSFAGVYVVSRRHHDFRLDGRFVLRVAAATAVAALVVLALSGQSAWAACAAAEAAFVVAAYATRAVSRRDLDVFLQRPAAGAGG